MTWWAVRRAVLVTSVAGLILAPVRGFAWPVGGVIVAPSGVPAQGEPRVLAGLHGSVLAYWDDGRWLDGRFDLYAQMLTPFGTVAPGWPDTGLMVVRAPDDQRTAAGLSAPDGSFLVGEYDYRNLPLGSGELEARLSHVRPEGLVDPAWPASGLLVFDRPRTTAVYQMVWSAPDTCVVLSGYSDNGIGRLLYQQVVLTPTGPVLPWGAAGVLPAVRPQTGQSTLAISPDGEGGVFGLQDELTSTEAEADWQADLYLTRLDRSGAFPAGWTGAKPVSLAPGPQTDASMCSDGAGGVYVAWADGRTGSGLNAPSVLSYFDIRLTRLGPDGLPRAGWPAEGLLVSDAPDQQDNPHLLPDGTGGVYVAWEDIPCITVTRVNGDGTYATGWGPNGLRTATPGYDLDARLVLDDIGGLYVLFENLSESALFLQHVLPWGAVDPTWPAAGYLVDLGFGAPGDICSDGAGGCYVTFEKQTVPGEPQVYTAIARYVAGGPVPVKLAETSAEAAYDHVHLVWRGGEATAADSRVQRRGEADASWRDLGAPVTTGQERLEFDDTSVEPGVRYAYRLVRGGSEVMSNEQWVDVPVAAAFALSGAWPNPALAREAAVRFTLTGAGPARLEVLDLAGRREHVRVLTSLGPGRHTVSLAEAQLAPGVHWLRLTEGAHEAHARMVVVR